eukprot:2740902-Rhodomonas_salina.1
MTLAARCQRRRGDGRRAAVSDVHTDALGDAGAAERAAIEEDAAAPAGAAVPAGKQHHRHLLLPAHLAVKPPVHFLHHHLVV